MKKHKIENNLTDKREVRVKEIINYKLIILFTYLDLTFTLLSNIC